jgi:hypothetical protein
MRAEHSAGAQSPGLTSEKMFTSPTYLQHPDYVRTATYNNAAESAHSKFHILIGQKGASMKTLTEAAFTSILTASKKSV